MYKITTYLTNSHLVLVRKKLSDGSCAALVVMRAPVRRYAKDFFEEKCPPPPPPKKSRKLLLGTIGATLLAGSAVVYAKNTPAARNWLETNAPWANKFIAVVYQEDETYLQFTMGQLGKISAAISGFVFGKEGISPMEFKQRSEQDLEKDAELGFKPKEYELPPPTLEPLYKEEIVVGTPDVEHEATLVQSEKCEPRKPPLINITKDVVQLEQEMHENTKVAIDNYKRALKLCGAYNRMLFKIIELPIMNVDKKQFTAMNATRTERDNAINKAKEAALKANCALDTLERKIASSDVHAPPENLTQTKRYIKEFRNDLAAAAASVKDEFEKASISDKYWDKVEQARNMYKDELQMLFPGIDLCAKELDIKSDADMLLLYTMKQVQFLQNELAELQTIREQKINKAIECNDEKALIEAKVEDTVKKQSLAKELEFQKKSLMMTAEANRKMREELRKQYEIHQDVTRAALARKEAEIMGKFSRSVSELVEKERVNFKKELAAMAGKLTAIEQTLKKRAAAETASRKSQSVWAAAEALLAATRSADTQRHIHNEIAQLEKAGQGDKLVQAVLNGISQDTREKGIITEKALKDKFEALEKTAAKVALIGREGASLPMYFLSWLQSKLLFQKLAQIPQSELENYPTDFSKLDTFDIIQRARYHLDNNDLAAALRYVNLLQGAPRAAAKCWVDSARKHLEVKQAAETVMAHASLSSMLDS